MCRLWNFQMTSRRFNHHVIKTTTFDGKRGRESENSLSLLGIFTNFWNFRILHEIYRRLKNRIVIKTMPLNSKYICEALFLCSLYFRIFGIFRSVNIRPSYGKKRNDIFRYEAKKSEISFGPVYFRIFGIFRRLEQRANRIEIKTTRSTVERAKFPLLDIFGLLRSNTNEGCLSIRRAKFPLFGISYRNKKDPLSNKSAPTIK